MEIEIINLTKIYNRKKVLDIDKLQINKGEIIGLVGNNGAGKTTFLRLIMDLIRHDTGMILSRGKNIRNSEFWKWYTSAFIDSSFLIDFLTPEEYFQFIASNYKLPTSELKSVLCDFLFFMNKEVLNQNKLIRDYSIGNQQKIGIVGAMLQRPEILFLDEPFNFLDPSSQIEMKRLIQKYNTDFGTTVLLSSHNIQYVADICNRIIILERGCIVRDEHNTTPIIKDELEQYFMKFR